MNPQKYLQLLRRLSPDDRQLEHLFDGSLRIPLASARQPPEAFGFPPALLPIWTSTGPLYFGMWRHWFLARQPVFVKLSPEADYRVQEIARTTAQLLRRILLDCISIADEVNDRVIAFADSAGVDNLQAIDDITLKSGDDPKGLLALDSFRQDPPRDCLGDADYHGEFPTGDGSLTLATLSRLAASELSREQLSAALRIGSVPLWFLPGAKAAVFEKYLAEHKLAEAWLTLNSQGWSFTEATEAMSKLEFAARSEDFSMLTEAWLENVSACTGGY